MWRKVQAAVVTDEPDPSAWDVVDVDKRDANGSTSLLNVCEQGDAKLCRLLIIQRAMPDVCAKDGQSPLYVSCRVGSLECARLLCARQRAVVNLPTNAGFTPLYVAAQKGHMPLVQLLLEEKANVNLVAKDGRAPLYAACESGHEAVASRLIRAGAAVDAPRSDHSTALVAAACFGQLGCVEVLLSARADLSAADSDGTALDNAWKQRRHDIVEVLQREERRRGAADEQDRMEGREDDDDEEEAETEEAEAEEEEDAEAAEAMERAAHAAARLESISASEAPWGSLDPPPGTVSEEHLLSFHDPQSPSSWQSESHLSPNHYLDNGRYEMSAEDAAEAATRANLLARELDARDIERASARLDAARAEGAQAADRRVVAARRAAAERAAAEPKPRHEPGASRAAVVERAGGRVASRAPLHLPPPTDGNGEEAGGVQPSRASLAAGRRREEEAAELIERQREEMTSCLARTDITAQSKPAKAASPGPPKWAQPRSPSERRHERRVDLDAALDKLYADDLPDTQSSAEPPASQPSADAIVPRGGRAQRVPDERVTRQPEKPHTLGSRRAGVRFAEEEEEEEEEETVPQVVARGRAAGATAPSAKERRTSKDRARSPERAAEYYRARSPGRGASRDGSRERSHSPEAEAAYRRSHERASARWARLERHSGGGSDDDSDDPEADLEDLRRQNRSRVKEVAWGKVEGTGVHAAELERRVVRGSPG